MSPAGAPGSATRRATIGGCAVGLGAGWTIANVGAIADSLAVDYGVALATVGLFTTALFVVHAAMQVPAGKLVDALGRAASGVHRPRRDGDHRTRSR